MFSLQKVPFVAFVGLGSQGKKHYEAGLQLEQQGKIKIVATCDPAQHQIGTYPHYQQYEEMLKSESIDVVVLAVPNVFHQKMCIQALQKKVSVLKEKPVALTLDQVAHLEKIAEENGVIVATFQQRMFKKEWHALFDLVQAAKEIKSFHFVFAVDDYVKSWYWNLNQAGGGVWLNMGWHPLQMITWLFGSITSISVATNTGGMRPWFYQTDHSAFAKVTLRSGITGSVFVSCVHPRKELVRIETDRGVLVLNQKSLIRIQNGVTNEVSFSTDKNDTYQLQLEHSLHMAINKKTTLKQDTSVLKNILYAQEERRKVICQN